ncbi:hypothetical protein N9J72_01540 [Candidatus Gracilibacteria bacterium]|nr:hypothetical protein [Candidatus Gracilibacteria bacterium]
MYKVVFNITSVKQLESFIFKYKKTFLDIYDDTGLFNEKIIRDNYIEVGDRLYGFIRERAVKILSDDTVLGTKDLDGKGKALFYSIRNYSIYLEYSENKILKERTVKNFIFYKK